MQMCVRRGLSLLVVTLVFFFNFFLWYVKLIELEYKIDYIYSFFYLIILRRKMKLYIITPSDMLGLTKCFL